MKLSKEVKNGMSRREFVKSTALKGAAAFAIGAGGLALPSVCQIERFDQDNGQDHQRSCP